MDIVGFLKSQFICHLLICYIFIVSGLIINFIQLFTLILWPINKQLFRRINCRLAYCISSRKILFLFCFKLFSYFVLRELFKKKKSEMVVKVTYIKIITASYSACVCVERCLHCWNILFCWNVLFFDIGILAWLRIMKKDCLSFDYPSCFIKPNEKYWANNSITQWHVLFVGLHC